MSGAAMLIRRSALQQVGGFDESFGLYAEELDLCTRLRDVGWKVLATPELQVMHVGGVWTGRSRRTYLMHSQSIYRYYRKHRATGWRRVTLPLAWAALRTRAELVALRSRVASGHDRDRLRACRLCAAKWPRARRSPDFSMTTLPDGSRALADRETPEFFAGMNRPDPSNESLARLWPAVARARLCDREQALELRDGNDAVIAAAGLHHGDSIRWREWSTDAELENAPALREWLGRHGAAVSPPDA